MLSFAVASMAFAAVVSAQTVGYHAINLPGMQEVVPACAPYTIVWTPSGQYSGDVTFQLIGGATPATLVPIGAMFGNVAGSAGSYTWDVPCDAGTEAVYGLKIHQVSDTTIFQYSMPFQIKANGAVDTSTTGDAGATPPVTSSADPKPTDTNTTSTATTITSDVPTTTAANATVTTRTPSQAVTTLTSVTTAEDGPTSTPNGTVSLASSYRITTGSFAMLAMAAAFLGL